MQGEPEWVEELKEGQAKCMKLEENVERCHREMIVMKTRIAWIELTSTMAQLDAIVILGNGAGDANQAQAMGNFQLENN